MLRDALPEWQCHKRVHAAQIASVDREGSALYLHTAGGGFMLHWVTPAWLEKHPATIGGYFVLYDDGYTSYSPKAVFEAGYSRVEERLSAPKGLKYDA